jgi:hypothetical protein
MFFIETLAQSQRCEQHPGKIFSVLTHLKLLEHILLSKAFMQEPETYTFNILCMLRFPTKMKSADQQIGAAIK